MGDRVIDLVDLCVAAREARRIRADYLAAEAERLQQQEAALQDATDALLAAEDAANAANTPEARATLRKAAKALLKASGPVVKPDKVCTCGAALIFAAIEPSGSPHPVEAASVRKAIVLSGDLSRCAVRNVGRSHFGACPHAAQHRRKGE